jgi:hypothetical protein
MSKKSVYVLVHPYTIDVVKKALQLMAPYHNDFEVEPYETDCDCLSESGAPDPDCEDCTGTGVHMTTSNTQPMFDDIYFHDPENILRTAMKNPSDLPEGAFTAPVKSLDIDKLRLPNTVITPTGEWLDASDFGPAYPAGHEGRWKDVVEQVLQQHMDATLVVLIYHQ